MVASRNAFYALWGTNNSMLKDDNLAAVQHMAAAATPVGFAACRMVCALWLAATLGVCSLGTLVGS
jgi:hypothetical protein